jgi:SAM-dependent methyltransferase
MKKNCAVSSIKAHLPYKIFYFIKYLILFAAFGGSRFKCPICEYSFRRLKSASTAGREAHCPVCWSLERHRLHYLFLKHRTNLFSANLKLLHIAPEESLSNLFSSLKNLSYTSADIDSAVAMKKWDIMQLPVKDEEFDAVLCLHALEHVEDDRKAMSELFRVLKKDGWAILSVPIDNRDQTFEDPSIKSPEDRKKAFGQKDHLRIYGRDFIQRLQSAGFKVSVDRFVKELSREAVLKYNLSKGENIFYCTKN